jgi:hypothetical protein
MVVLAAASLRMVLVLTAWLCLLCFPEHDESIALLVAATLLCQNIILFAAVRQCSAQLATRTVTDSFVIILLKSKSQKIVWKKNEPVETLKKLRQS